MTYGEIRRELESGDKDRIARARRIYARSRRNSLMVEQLGRCAICGAEGDWPAGPRRRPTKPALHLDHCHKTGHIRGLLCAHCNRGLGLFEDNLGLLLSAIDYLKRAAEEAGKRQPIIAQLEATCLKEKQQ